MALVHTPELEFGKPIPDFNSVLAMDEKKYSLQDIPKNNPVLFMFICNHCPYVKAIEDRLITLGHDLKKINVAVFAVCSNDSQKYSEDSYLNLQKRAREMQYPFIYLHDADQKMAQNFGAVCTPDFFLYDKNHRLAYRGRLDDSWKDPQLVTRRELFLAATLLAENKAISSPQIASMGCSIKWTGHK